MKTLMRIIGLVLLGIIILLAGAWSLLTLTYAGSGNEFLRNASIAVVGIYLLATLLAMFSSRWRWRVLVGYLVLFFAVVVWFEQIEPSNDRDWQADVAVMPSATVEGDLVTVHNIRNFDYRSETDFTPAYYDKQFDLREFEGVDVVAVYWMGPAVAHIFLSFAFAGDQHLAVSIETRKEKGEDYSTVKGFFRNYEIFYVVADERDVIRLRTNFRQDPIEDVYVYRAAGSLEQGRRLFLEYVKQINGLTTKPEFYNTLTSNCTTTIWVNAHVNEQRVPLNWKLFVSGYLPDFLYENERLEAGNLSFEALRQQAHVNAKAIAAGSSLDFSKLIRSAMPIDGAYNMSLPQE